jgi:putative membrane protein
MKRALIVIGAIAFSSVCASGLASKDAELVRKASIGNMFEQQAAQLALEKAADPEIKQFAQKMLTDHGSAERALQDAAQSAGANPETRLDAAHQSKMRMMQSKSGR